MHLLLQLSFLPGEKNSTRYARTEVRDWVPSAAWLVDVSTKALVSKSGFSAWIRTSQLRPSSSNRALPLPGAK
jgi:hypothetical protein